MEKIEKISIPIGAHLREFEIPDLVGMGMNRYEIKCWRELAKTPKPPTNLIDEEEEDDDDEGPDFDEDDE